MTSIASRSIHPAPMGGNIKPLITVIVPAFNAGHFINETLRSIALQTYENWECIVVDDGCTDETSRRVQHWMELDDRFRLIRQPNRGGNAARNLGFMNRDERSEFCMFCDADDVLLPQALETLLESAQQHPEMSGAHGLSETMDLNGNVLQQGAYSRFLRERKFFNGSKIVDASREQPTSFEVLLVKPMCPPCMFLLRCDAVEKIGGFAVHLTHAQDLDFLLRLSRVAPIAFEDAVVAHYRRHPGNRTNQEGRVHRMVRLIRRDIYRSLPAAERRAFRRFYRQHQVTRIREKWDRLRTREKSATVLGPLRTVAEMMAHAAYFVRGVPTRWG